MNNQSVKLDSADDYILDVFEPKRKKKIKEECELCNMEVKTEWFYDSNNWVICLCRSCKRPMVVYKEHTMFVPLPEVMKIMNKVYEIFGDVTIRFKQRKIKKVQLKQKGQAKIKNKKTAKTYKSKRREK